MRRPWNSLRRFLSFPTRPRTIVRRRPTRQRLCLELLENRVAPAVSLINHTDSPWSGASPPDTNGAAGPNSYIETGNSYVNIYNKSTNATIAQDYLSHFYYTTGGLTPADSHAGLSDATMCYDEPIGRFIVADLDTDRTGGGAYPPSQVDLAVSKNSNPTDLSANNWTFYSIATSEGSLFSDYPGNIGYNADALVFTWNMGGNSPGHVLVDALNQSNLAAGGSVGYTYFDVYNPSTGLRPVTMHDSVSGGPMWFVQEGFDNKSIYLDRVDNILNPSTFAFSAFKIGVNSYNSINAPLNPDGSAITTNLDTRIMKAAERYNDIVASQHVGVGSNEDDARWYEFNVSNINSPYLVQQGNVGFGANTYVTYPAIDINYNGDIAMGFTKSGNDYSTDYASTYITGWNHSIDSAGNMETPVKVKAGDSNLGGGREGDFSGINVDPNDGTFWVNDEYSGGGSSHQEIANFQINRQNFYLVGGQLQIYGDQLGSGYSDTITVDVNGRGGVYATLNGEPVGFDPGQVTSIWIDPHLGTNYVYVYNVPSGLSATDITGDGVNYVNIGSYPNGVQGIKSLVYVFNGYSPNFKSATGYSYLTISDYYDTVGRSAQIYHDGAYGGHGYINNLAPAQIDWIEYTSGSNPGGVYGLTIYGGSGGNTFTVAGLSVPGGTTLSSGSGYNTVNVEGTNSSLTVDGGSGFQAVYVGSNGSSLGGTLANIAGSVFVENSNTSGSSNLYVDDGGDSTGRTWNLYFDSISSTGLPGSISWNTYGPGYGGVTYLQARGGSGFNTFNVYSTGSSPFSYGTDLYTGTGGASVYVSSTLGYLDVINQGSQDYVYVGDTSSTSFGSGSLTSINGSVDVFGSGSTYLYLDDGTDSTSRTANMYDGYLTGLAPATIYWSPTSSSTGGVTFLDIYGSAAGSTYTVNNTSHFYYYTYLITGGGSDTVNVLGTQSSVTYPDGLYDYNSGGQDYTYVGSTSSSFGTGTGTMANINGSVLAEGAGSTYLYLDDTADATGRTVNMSNGQLTGLSTGNINWSPTSSSTGGVTYLDVLGSGGGSTYNVNATSNFYYYTFLQTGGGNDTVNVKATTGGLYVYNRGGADTVTIGSLAPSLGGTLAGINGFVDVYGAGGSTALVVDDSGDSTARTATLYSTQLTGLGNTGTIYYSSPVTSLTIDGGSGNNTWDINSTASGTPVTINAGNGANTFVVTPSSDALSNIQGALTLHGGTGSNTLTVDDQNDATNDTYTLGVGSIARTGAAAITYSGTFSSVTVNGSSTAATTYNLNTTAASTPLTINAGSGANILNLTPTTKKLNNLAGAVTINAGSASTVNVDDQSNTAVSTYTVTSTAVSRSGFGGLTYAGLGTLVLNGGSAADTYNIQSTAAGSTVKVNGGAGSDIFNLGSGNSLNGIQGALTVSGGGGTNTLNANDSSSGSGQSYALSSTQLTRSGIAAITYASMHALNVTGSGNDTLTLLSPAPTVATTFNGGSGNNTIVGSNAATTWTISGPNSGKVGNVTFSNVQNLKGGTGADTFNFTTSTASLSGTLNGGGGTDKISYSTLGSSYLVTVTLSSNTAGTATAIGGGFSNIATVAGSTDTANKLTGPNLVNAWSITGTNTGKVNTFSFSGMANLVGGNNVDVFKFSGTGSVAGTISGGGAPLHQGDWLDYSLVTYAVSVNLGAGTASNTGGVSGIQNVHGGNHGNTLTGSAQGNILIGGSGTNTITGGSGMSILIADKGASTIKGGSANGDILIGDYTTYDTMSTANENALMGLLAEWQSADSYATRFHDINTGTGGGLNGTAKLNWGTTVKDDAGTDAAYTLTAHGASGLDWFFLDSNDTKANYAAGDHVNNT